MFRRLFDLLKIGALLLMSCAAQMNAAQGAAQALPPPGAYKVDPDHSFTYFSAWHHIVGVVRGRFDRVTGTITVAQDPADCGVDITIAAYSLSTQNTERDSDLRGPDFFNVEQFPTIAYKGRGIHQVAGGAWRLDGSLTIRGISKEVPLTFTFKGKFPDTKPGRPMRVAFHGSAATKRGDFGMTRDNLMELGASPGPGPDVDIEIDVEADAKPAAR